MENESNYILEAVEKYENMVEEKPFAILVSPGCYLRLEEEVARETFVNYEMPKSKQLIEKVYNIPVEIAYDLNVEAICVNEEFYNNYKRRSCKW